jgi:hypothetical protein
VTSGYGQDIPPGWDRADPAGGLIDVSTGGAIRDVDHAGGWIRLPDGRAARDDDPGFNPAMRDRAMGSAGTATPGSQVPQPQTLDAALARRDEKERQLAESMDVHHRVRREGFSNFWAVVDDFLARSPLPGHNLTHVERHLERRRFRRGRLRVWDETEALGAGWWLGVIGARSPDNESRYPGPWSHEVVFLLPGGDLVAGKTTGLWETLLPTLPPLERDIQIGVSERVRHGDHAEVVLQLKVADALTHYLH